VAAVKPGDERYRLAELPFRAGYHEAPSRGASEIVAALDGDLSPEACGVSPPLVEVWRELDAGREAPPVAADDALERMRSAFASLPDDTRCELAAAAEAAAWRYHRADLEHLRIVAAREAEEQQEVEAAREREAAEQTQRIERGIADLDQQLREAREQREFEAEEEAQRVESERAASEKHRRAA
jgi:hypothetical protein